MDRLGFYSNQVLINIRIYILLHTLVLDDDIDAMTSVLGVGAVTGRQWQWRCGSGAFPPLSTPWEIGPIFRNSVSHRDLWDACLL
jgi:hypothetical protein